jgi:ABC-2 type transport system permease protein
MMQGALEIARRDLARLFAGPLAWTVLALLQLVLGLFFFIVFLWDFGEKQPLLVAAKSSFGITAYVAAPLFKAAALLMLLVVPLLTMRALAEERRSGTMALLLSAPVSMTGIVLGKYLALLAFMAIAAAAVGLMPLSLALGGTLDAGLLASAGLGLFLSFATFAAAGLYVSSLTAQPTTAGMGALGLLLALWFIDAGGATGSGGPAELFAWLSLTHHMDALMRGVFASADVAYFVILITTFLVFTVRRLDALRLGQ